MDTLIVYIDDAAYAQQQLIPMVNAGAATRWVLVACPPRMGRTINKWISHSVRMNWREQWSAKVFARIVPLLHKDGGSVQKVVANGPLPALTEKLRASAGSARVLDARRPKFGVVLEPVVKNQPREQQSWQIPGAVAGFSAALVLAAD